MYDIHLRDETVADDNFLRGLYASTRGGEMSLLPWTDAEKSIFLNQQFNLQRRHYRQHFPDAEFMLVLLAGQAVGRWYVQRGADAYLLIDVALLPAHRGQGLGGFLMNRLLSDAANAKKPVRLHVEKHNRAQNLYTRLGFDPINDEGVYLLMEWRPG
ncbi:MAG: GNAT family N-acetyltransferase [Methylomonas sp.]|jgi:GNAT superfamily N-acetyltransferase